MGRRRNRRQFPRFSAPDGLGPALPEVFHRFLDISIGGMRVISASGWKPGELVRIEIRFPTGGSLLVTCEVVWTSRISFENAPANEVGLRFTDLADFDRARIATLLAGARRPRIT